MNKKLLLFFVIILVLAVGIYFFINKSNSKPSNQKMIKIHAVYMKMPSNFVTIYNDNYIIELANSKKHKKGQIQLNLDDLKKRIIKESEQHNNNTYADYQITFDNDNTIYYLNK